MSRTFKDRPYWIRVNDPKTLRYAVHHHASFGHVYTPFNGKPVHILDYCTIDEPYSAGDNYPKPCYYRLISPHRYDETTKEMRHNAYWEPMRTDERIVLRNAVKDYNTYGEIDEDFFLQENHRHARYGGVYWD